MKKGFTLIELLAVIVIIAIISLIAIPEISKLIEKSQQKEAIQSTYGYIKAVKYSLVTNSLKDDIYNPNEISANYDGDGPSNGLLTIKKNIVNDAKLCIHKFSIDYSNSEAVISKYNYCGTNKVTLYSNGVKIKTLSEVKNYTVDLKNKTNIYCNNGAIPTVNNGKLTVKRVIGNISCDISSSLKYSFSHFDDSVNNIVMVNDEILKDGGLTVGEKKNVVFDLNGKNIEVINPNGENIENYDPSDENSGFSYKYVLFNLYGSLTINDKSNTSHVTTPINSPIVYSYKNAKLSVNGGIYLGRNFLQNYSTGSNSKIVINNGVFSSKLHSIVYSNTDGAVTTINGGYYTDDKNTCVYNGKGTMYINGGTYICSVNNVLTNMSNKNVYINATKNKIYMRSDALDWNPPIWTNNGTIYIKAHNADKCTSNPDDTKIGLCIYAEGDKNYNQNSSNGAIQNYGPGKVFIDGGTYHGGFQGINNDKNGIVYIKNADIISKRYGVFNHTTGVINVCDSNIQSSYADLAFTNWERSTGTINYNNSVRFTNYTNIPKTYQYYGTIKGNYSGSCTEKDD